MWLNGIFRKNKMKKAPLTKISLLVQIGGEIKAPLQNCLGSIQAYARGIYMESSELNIACVSQPIYTNKLIFGKWEFFTLFFLDMLTYFIISQI